MRFDVQACARAGARDERTAALYLEFNHRTKPGIEIRPHPELPVKRTPP